MHRRVLLAASLALAPAVARAQVAEGWAALRRPGAVALLRHAEAPGFGDPPDFRADDCATQRNLSPEGRAQAAGLGDAFRANGLGAATVLHSAWCRCRDTAGLLRLGAPLHEPALDSLFRLSAGAAAERTVALRARIAAHDPARLLVLVTHEVNVAALCGVSPRSAEVVAVSAGQPGRVIARIPPP